MHRHGDPDDYRKSIEKDPALKRRFKTVYVDEPSVEDTVKILHGLRHRYEEHHGVQITDDALWQAARLSDRYITDQFLPDKAIDLIDETAAKVRLAATELPAEARELLEEITRLEDEEEAAVAEQNYELAARIRDQRTLKVEELKRYEEAGREPVVPVVTGSTWRRPSPPGPGSPSATSRRRTRRGSSGWRRRSTSGTWARTRR